MQRMNSEILHRAMQRKIETLPRISISLLASRMSGPAGPLYLTLRMVYTMHTIPPQPTTIIPADIPPSVQHEPARIEYRYSVSLALKDV